jgi:hypothetical protein
METLLERNQGKGKKETSVHLMLPIRRDAERRGNGSIVAVGLLGARVEEWARTSKTSVTSGSVATRSVAVGVGLLGRCTGLRCGRERRRRARLACASSGTGRREQARGTGARAARLDSALLVRGHGAGAGAVCGYATGRERGVREERERRLRERTEGERIREAVAAVKMRARWVLGFGVMAPNEPV